MIRKLLAVTMLLPLTVVGRPALASCGPQPEPCQIDGGQYHLAIPESGSRGAPVMVFLHGFGGSGKGTIGNKRVVDPLLARGWAVIAPEGMRRDGDGPQYWRFRTDWPGRDDTAFLQDVVANAASEYGIDTDRVILAGFSNGAFLVNYLACATPDSFAAYAPVSGGFWRPQPASCAGPVKLFHTHGWSDSTVPIEGRKLRNGAFQQGDIFAGLEVWRAANGCTDEKPSAFSETGPFLRREWMKCDPDSALELAIWSGGHTVPAGWSDMTLDWFEAVTQP